MADATCRDCGESFEQSGSGRPRVRCLGCAPRKRPLGTAILVACPECCEMFVSKHANTRFCSDSCRYRYRDRGRMAPCSVCGDPMHIGSSSLAVGAARHNRCQPKPHGGIWQYKNGCRCDECRAGNSERAQSWQRKHSYWSRPDVVARRKAQRSTVEAREYERSRWARYYVENRDAVVANSKAKEARRKGASSIPFTAEQLDARLSMWAGCWMCGCDLGDDFHVDHVKPLSRGGWHCLSNLRPACGPCNLSKGAKWPLGSLTVSV